MNILSLSGMLAMFGSFIISAKYVCDNHYTKFSGQIIFILSLLFFTPFQYQNIAWPMAIISQTYVFFMALVSLYIIIKYNNVYSLAISIFFAFICVFSNGNGFLLICSAIYLCAKDHIVNRKMSKKYLLYMFFICLFVILFFYKYETKYSPIYNYSIEGILIYCGKLVEGFFTISTIIGGIFLIIIIVALFLRKTLRTDEIFPECLIIFSLLSICTVVFIRTGNFNSFYPLEIRVPERHIYPVIFMTASTIMAFRKKVFSRSIDKKILNTILFAVLLVFIANYANQKKSLENFSKQHFESHLEYIKNNKPFFLSNVLDKTVTSYEFPENCKVIHTEFQPTPSMLTKKIHSEIKELIYNKGYIFLNGSFYDKSTHESRIKLFFVSPEHTYEVIPNTQLFRKEHLLVINSKHFNKGIYKIWVQFTKIDNLIYDTGKKIDLLK